jgi:hypothetical protein
MSIPAQIAKEVSAWPTCMHGARNTRDQCRAFFSTVKKICRHDRGLLFEKNSIQNAKHMAKHMAERNEKHKTERQKTMDDTVPETAPLSIDLSTIREIEDCTRNGCL